MCIAAEHQLADLIDDDEDNMKEGKKGIQLDSLLLSPCIHPDSPFSLFAISCFPSSSHLYISSCYKEFASIMLGH